MAFGNKLPTPKEHYFPLVQIRFKELSQIRQGEEKLLDATNAEILFAPFLQGTDYPKRKRELFKKHKLKSPLAKANKLLHIQQEYAHEAGIYGEQELTVELKNEGNLEIQAEGI